MRREFTLTLVALALLALTACNVETEVTPPDPSQGNPISFDSVSTRADLSDIQTNGFGVWAFIDNTTVQDYVLMDNQEVTYDGGEWTYSPLKYWIDDTEFTFMAIYPYGLGNNFTVDTANRAINLVVSETPSTVDYLAAENVTDTRVDGYNTTVPLQFKHMLTSVTLNIWRDGGKHQNDQMRITKVTLSNIRKSGSYSSATDTWTYGGDKLTLEMNNNTEPSDSDDIGAAINNNGNLDTGGEPCNPFGTMILLPQALDNSNLVSLKIEYQLKRQNAASWETAELETVLPTITWSAGQQYTYNVVLSSVTDITVYYIQTKVDPWGTPQVGGTVIIK